MPSSELVIWLLTVTWMVSPQLASYTRTWKLSVDEYDTHIDSIRGFVTPSNREVVQFDNASCGRLFVWIYVLNGSIAPGESIHQRLCNVLI